jgi:hypothetical protein
MHGVYTRTKLAVFPPIESTSSFYLNSHLLFYLTVLLFLQPTAFQWLPVLISDHISGF